MITFIDKHYSNITSIHALLGFILFFTASEYVGLILLSYGLINAIKFREPLWEVIRTTPPGEKIIHIFGVIIYITILTTIMYFSSGFIKKFNIPGFFQFLYVAVIFYGSLFIYVPISNFFIKKMRRRNGVKAPSLHSR